MAGTIPSKYAEILLSCIEEEYFETEVVLEHHAFARVVSGEMQVIQPGKTYRFGPGDSLLFPRNELSTLIKRPANGLPYKAVVVSLTSERLQDFYIKNPIQSAGASVHHIKFFGKHPLLDSFFASLTPYFDLESKLPEQISSMKIEEALTILRLIDKDTDSFLADFSQPGKIDLADFMKKNFRNNLSLERFATLTGRSLTTFKRDFKTLFNDAPQKWLTRKRLDLAHHLLSEKKGQPVEIYTETGFENLSHFSFAFKKQFGYAPTALSGNNKTENANLQLLTTASTEQ